MLQDKVLWVNVHKKADGLLNTCTVTHKHKYSLSKWELWHMVDYNFSNINLDQLPALNNWDKKNCMYACQICSMYICNFAKLSFPHPHVCI